MNEHNPECNNPSQETDVTRHLQNHPDHHIDFDSLQILARSNNNRKLCIKETLLIQKLQPQLNVDNSSHPIYLFNVWCFKVNLDSLFICMF